MRARSTVKRNGFDLFSVRVENADGCVKSVRFASRIRANVALVGVTFDRVAVGQLNVAIGDSIGTVARSRVPGVTLHINLKRRFWTKCNRK